MKSADPGTIGATNQVSVTNTYPNTGTLKLYKDLAAGTSADTYGTEVFYYTVTLNKPTGTSIDLRDFIDNTTIANLPNNTNENPARFATDGYTADTIVIENIGVKKNDTNGVSIAGIPYGTSYTVSENLTNAQTTANWKKLSEVYGTTDATDNTKHYIGAEVTTGDNQKYNSYKAANVKTGSLELEKDIAPGTSDTGTFIYKVVLTAPTDFDLDGYNTSNTVITSSHGFATAPTGVTFDPAQQSYGTSDGKETYTFYVDVTADTITPAIK